MRRQSVHAASAALAALAVFLAEPAWAQAHKCQTPGGPVTYSDQPCASAQAGGPITLRPNSMDGSEGRAQDQRAAAAQAAPPASRAGRASSRHSNSWACRNALRSRVDAEQFEQECQAASRACGHEVRAKPPREPKARPLRKQRAASSPASREKRRSKP